MDTKELENFFTLAARLAGLKITHMGFAPPVTGFRGDDMFVVYVRRREGLSGCLAITAAEKSRPDAREIAEARWCAAVDEMWNYAAKRR